MGERYADNIPIEMPILGLISPRKATFVVEYCKDFNPRRAAEAASRSVEWAHKMLNDDEVVQQAIINVVNARHEDATVTSEWLLQEAVDNHRIARQQGNLSASNTALMLIARHKLVDALASAQLNVNLNVDEEVKRRLIEGRKRARILDVKAVEVKDDEPAVGKISFL